MEDEEDFCTPAVIEIQLRLREHTGWRIRIKQKPVIEASCPNPSGSGQGRHTNPQMCILKHCLNK